MVKCISGYFCRSHSVYAWRSHIIISDSRDELCVTVYIKQKRNEEGMLHRAKILISWVFRDNFLNFEGAISYSRPCRLARSI